MKTVLVKITKSADQNKVGGSLNGRPFRIPVDGEFHPISEDLLPALDHSDVDYEIGQPAPKAPAGAAAGHGGQAAAPSKPKAKPKARPKAKHKPKK